jgi:hypothetical protein
MPHASPTVSVPENLIFFTVLASGTLTVSTSDVKPAGSDGKSFADAGADADSSPLPPPPTLTSGSAMASIDEVLGSGAEAGGGLDGAADAGGLEAPPPPLPARRKCTLSMLFGCSVPMTRSLASGDEAALPKSSTNSSPP